MRRHRKPNRKVQPFHLEMLERRELMSASPWQAENVASGAVRTMAAAEEWAHVAEPLAGPSTTTLAMTGSTRAFLNTPPKVPPSWESNVAIGSLVVADADGKPVNPREPWGPFEGEPLYVSFRWFTHNLHEGKSYSIQVSLDGNTVFARSGLTGGAGTLASEFYSSKEFGQIAIGEATSGRHTVTVTITSADEGRTDDNRDDYSFTTVNRAAPYVKSLDALKDINIADVNGPVWSYNPKQPGVLGGAIADSRNSQSFDIKAAIEYGHYKPNEVQVRARWSIDGEVVVSSGWHTAPAGATIMRFSVDTPPAVGQYDLTLEFEFLVKGKTVETQQMVHDLYVTIGDSIGAAPRTEWLQLATQLAKGTTASVAALTAANDGLYKLGGERGWTYAQLKEQGSVLSIGTKGRELELLYGTAKRANCLDMSHAWQHLAEVLGISGVTVSGDGKITGDNGLGFLTTTGREAFDKSFGNARNSLGQLDRWYFDFHQLGKYSENGTTIYFDNTFRGRYSSVDAWRVNIAADSLTSFSAPRDRRFEEVTVQFVATGAKYQVKCLETIETSGTGNSEYVYFKPGPPPIPAPAPTPPHLAPFSATVRGKALELHAKKGVHIQLAETVNSRGERLLTVWATPGTNPDMIVPAEVLGYQQFNLNHVDRIVYRGTSGDDWFSNRTSIPSVMYGGDGNDFLEGGSNRDVIYGGRGNDVLHGNGGNDVLRGGAGHDKAYGGAGNDVVFGGSGNDFLDGGLGDDLLRGCSGNDILRGANGRDRLFGDAGSDRLVGGAGNDILRGGAGDDVMMGGTGDDVMYGNDGKDEFFAGLGNDSLFGGLGLDIFHDAKPGEIKHY